MAPKTTQKWLAEPENILSFLLSESGIEEEKNIIEVQLCIDDSDAQKKKYCIKVPKLQFVGEFYQCEDDETRTTLHGKYCDNSVTFPYDYDSVEGIASKWFVDMLSDETIHLRKIEMDLIGKPPNFKGTFNFCNVTNLEIKIPDNNYEDGLLEWWLKRFPKGIDFLKIESKPTSDVVVDISEHLYNFDNCRKRLELHGRFVIRPEVLSKIQAEKVVFKDYSEVSTIDSSLGISILKHWIDVVTPPREIIFIATYKETDIAQEIYNHLREKYASLRKNESTNTYSLKIVPEAKNAAEKNIQFYHNNKFFNIKLF